MQQIEHLRLDQLDILHCYRSKVIYLFEHANIIICYPYKKLHQPQNIYFLESCMCRYNLNEDRVGKTAPCENHSIGTIKAGFQ